MAKDMDKFITDSDAYYKRLSDILCSKQRDYSPNNIALAPGGAMNGLLVRMNDKMERLKNLYYNTVDPYNESFDDSLLDLANYCVIALMVRNGEWPTE